MPSCLMNLLAMLGSSIVFWNLLLPAAVSRNSMATSASQDRACFWMLSSHSLLQPNASWTWWPLNLISSSTSRLILSINRTPISSRPMRLNCLKHFAIISTEQQRSSASRQYWCSMNSNCQKTKESETGTCSAAWDQVQEPKHHSWSWLSWATSFRDETISSPNLTTCSRNKQATLRQLIWLFRQDSVSSLATIAIISLSGKIAMRIYSTTSTSSSTKSTEKKQVSNKSSNKCLALCFQAVDALKNIFEDDDVQPKLKPAIATVLPILAKSLLDVKCDQHFEMINSIAKYIDCSTTKSLDSTMKRSLPTTEVCLEC